MRVGINESITFGQSPKTPILTICFLIIVKSQTFQSETMSLYEGTFYLMHVGNFKILHKHVGSEYLYEIRIYITFSNVGCHGNTYPNELKFYKQGTFHIYKQGMCKIWLRYSKYYQRYGMQLFSGRGYP